MKRIAGLLALLMALVLAMPVLADAPAAGSLTMTQETVRNNTSFTLESYPEIWITPYFDEHIIVGLADYPPVFMRFSPPEGTMPMEFDYDSAAFIDHENLLVYSYYAYDRASFEVFLEKAAAENTVADGSDGIAIYANPDARLGRALIDIKDVFGKTSKLEIIVNDYNRDATSETLLQMIEAETARVMDSMTVETLDGYWSADVFASVELADNSGPVTAIVDVSGYTMTKVDESELTLKEKATERSAGKTRIQLDDYAYVLSKEETEGMTLADGSEWLVYIWELGGYASRVVAEEGRYGPVYLTINIDTEPDSFIEKVEELWSRIEIVK